MLIGIDGNEANEVRADIGAPAGVNVYAFELLRSIHKLQDEWKDKHSVVVYLRRKPSSLLPKETEYFKYKVLGGGGLWVMTRLTPHLCFTDKRPDVIFSPSHYAPFLAPMPKVVSIMDIGYLKNSGYLKKMDFWQLKYWTAISVSASRKVLAISKSTKDDIVRHYPSSAGKVVVTPLAHDPAKFNSRTLVKEEKVLTRIKSKYSIGLSYVLYLGVLKPNKNVAGLISAWGRIVHEYPKITLVIAGKKGWGYGEIFSTVKALRLTQKVVFTDYVPESDKPALIAGAKLFVLPSFWEGFGLDVLNAMASGVPVAVSRAGSLPEVAGRAGTYFDPNNHADIARKISRVLSLSKVDYNKIAKQSLEQAKKFSWDDTARLTLKTLESIR
ncbi:hypothetical protein A2125_00295 [Candidatus Woesebacteria bacterium GWB1_43_5]|uniref:Glycosyl transferase family 1 domain-containing protein n=1 Tax=Candidatus Woesebacteria bacterium GWB1_43_5 TaxID=1802474 RepID=A0A1F7WRS8_9BACT|nr:MAG: hypothetical protein A2125_00295 [Candidatus Woesebacteria bacterium GWB1_43_5]